jgi:hypothetical protein
MIVNHKVFYRRSLKDIFFADNFKMIGFLGFGLLVMSVGVGLSMKSVLISLELFFGASAFFGVFMFLSFKTKKVTNQIKFNENGFTLLKKKKYDFLFTHVFIREFEMRSMWEGLIIRSGSFLISLWENDFSDKDWRRIKRILKSKVKFGDKEFDYISWIAELD